MLGERRKQARDRSPHALRSTIIPAHSIGWTGGRAADALFGAGGGVGATVVGVWLSGVAIAWLSLTAAWGAGLAGLRGGRAWLDPPKPQDRAMDGPAVKPTTAPATAPIGPSTTAPDNAPKAASPTRSWAIAAEDISARVSTTNANVFFIRVPCLSPAQHQAAWLTRKSPPFAAGPSHWRKRPTSSLSRYPKIVCGNAVTALCKVIQTRPFHRPALRDALSNRAK